MTISRFFEVHQVPRSLNFKLEEDLKLFEMPISKNAEVRRVPLSPNLGVPCSYYPLICDPPGHPGRGKVRRNRINRINRINQTNETEPTKTLNGRQSTMAMPPLTYSIIRLYLSQQQRSIGRPCHDPLLINYHNTLTYASTYSMN
jgi:hypothetical protein